MIKRGDIFYADLNPIVGSEQGGIRPVLVIQNDVGNKYSPTITSWNRSCAGLKITSARLNAEPRDFQIPIISKRQIRSFGKLRKKFVNS